MAWNEEENNLIIEKLDEYILYLGRESKGGV